MKKMISTILAVLLMISVMPAGLFDIPASAVSDGYYTYSVSNGEATITDCNTSISGDITIPSTLGGYPVTTIGSNAFLSCSSLASITIPNSVTSIGESAFHRCSSLTSITVDNNNEHYSSENGVLFNKTKTEIICYPMGKTVTSYTIPNSVTSIGSNAFYHCSRLTSITIPNSVTSIGEYAFNSCSSLTSITIPNSLTSIDPVAFYGCSSLTSITADNNNEHYSSENGILFNKTKTEIIYYPMGKTATSYTIPNSVTSIGSRAFYYCSRLTSITIPNSVTSIGSHAFAKCSGLTSITIPDSVTSIGSRVFDYCSSLTSITIPNSVTSIGEYAFNHCSSLTSVTIPNSVTSIGYGAFNYCSSLTSVTIPNSVTSIGEYAFRSCSSLTSITIPNSVTGIGDSAFSGCLSLTSITIPDSVTSIGKYAFEDCSGLTSITLGNTVTSIGSFAFYNCSKLTSITIPNCVTSIGSGAFYGCTSLTNITIPNSVTSIGSGAFFICTSLTNITIPNSVTSIGDCAFYSCYKLTSITIPNSVTSIGCDAFFGCESLINVYFRGTAEEKEKIYIEADGNACLNEVVWHYNSCIGKLEHSYENNCDNECNICGEIRTITHNYKWVIDTEPDCGNNGTKHEECAICQAKRNEGTLIEATGNHKYDNSCDTSCNICGEMRTITHDYEWVIDAESDCGNNGTKHEECTICQANRNEGTTIEATGNHKYDNDEDFYCNVCGNRRLCLCPVCEGSGTLDKLSSCTNCSGTGSIKTKCTSCNGSGNKGYQNTSGSCSTCGGDGVATGTVKVTCGSCSGTGGYRSCGICGRVLSSGQSSCYYCSYGVTNYNTCSSCNGKGYKTQLGSVSCSSCGGDGQISGSTPIKCTSCSGSGYHTNDCSECIGGNVSTNVTCTACAGTGEHSFEWVIDRENNCGVDGFKHEECSVCHTKRNEGTAINATGNHSYEWIIDKENNCGVDGFKHEECSVCHIKLNENTVINATGNHSFEWVIDKVNNCVKDGVKHEECSVCHTKRNENTVLPATGHIYDNGSDSSCNVCGHKRQYYTLTYNGNGENGAPNKQTLYEGTVITLPTIVSDYYRFLGWSKTPNGEVDYKTGHSYTITENVTLYAKWAWHCYYCDDTGIDQYYYNGNYYSRICTECGGKGFSPIPQVKAPQPQLASKTSTSVTLVQFDGVDYSMDGETWQESNVFKNLIPEKEYCFFMRYKANGIHTVGSYGARLYVTTNSLFPSTITSSKYTIGGKNISKITAGTTVSSLLAGLNEGSYCKVYKGNSVVSGNTAVGTGMVVKIMDGNTVKASYTVIVTGDTNGDGAISVTDMIAIKAHILNKSTLTGVYATAANTNGDSGISITDFIQVKAKILGKGSITAR